jgi:hypothetical protein
LTIYYSVDEPQTGEVLSSIFLTAANEQNQHMPCGCMFFYFQTQIAGIAREAREAASRSRISITKGRGVPDNSSTRFWVSTLLITIIAVLNTSMRAMNGRFSGIRKRGDHQRRRGRQMRIRFIP